MLCPKCFISPMRVLPLVIGAVLAATATAQPPDGPPPGRPLPPHPDPLRRALDTDGDHELDADEIANATESLGKLDANGDGRISRAELAPRPPEGGPGDRDAAGRAGPPGLGRGPLPEGVPPPLRGGDGFRPPPGPDPERFVERAMAFDADGDGKLDRAELGKFAEEMMGRRRPDGDRPRRQPQQRPQPDEDDAAGNRPGRPRGPVGDRPAVRPRRPLGAEERPAPAQEPARDGT